MQKHMMMTLISALVVGFVSATEEVKAAEYREYFHDREGVAIPAGIYKDQHGTPTQKRMEAISDEFKSENTKAYSDTLAKMIREGKYWFKPATPQDLMIIRQKDNYSTIGSQERTNQLVFGYLNPAQEEIIWRYIYQNTSDSTK